jgi:hypothetical protein
MKLLNISLAVVVAVLLFGKVSASTSSLRVQANASASPGIVGPELPQTCEAMYGTAFKSQDERAWFNSNCVHSPQADFMDPAQAAGMNSGSGESQPPVPGAESQPESAPPAAAPPTESPAEMAPVVSSSLAPQTSSIPQVPMTNGLAGQQSTEQHGTGPEKVAIEKQTPKGKEGKGKSKN